ncbi:MAG: hypothetical protein ACI9RM_001481 [Ulvibacter sp.]|jgi:hypothetical protein
MRKILFLLITLITVSTFSQSFFQAIPEARPIANRSVIEPIVATIPYQGYDETQAFLGEGEYEIFIDNIDGVLDKPIIVLDGFDPGDSRDIAGLYNSLSFGGQNMADILRSEGFDIVVLNAPLYTTDGKDIDGGSDYIQRNAMVLVALIDLLNSQKVGDEELVVLGASMGGLIGRYGLAYMEQNSLPAETRLYISFDSPHRGANIPISLQYLINYLAQQTSDPDAIAIVDGVLNSPAAKEMLYDHLLGHLLSGSTFEQDPTLLLPVGAPNFRDAFQAELDAIGFPQQVRNVAMVNGSAVGTATGTPGIEVINTNLNIGTGVTADVNLHFTPLASQINNVTTFNSFLVGIPVATFGADAQSFATSDGIDASPGGTGDIASALGGAGTTNPIILAFINALDQEEYSFIPVLSSLAIDNEDNWFATPDIGGIHNSPFVNTYIPNNNEPHVTVTQASAQFALDEIRNGSLGLVDNDFSQKYKLTQNPVSENIQIKLNNTSNYSKVIISVFAISGQQLSSDQFVNPTQEINLGHSLSSGIYLLNIKDLKGSYNLKFAVK